MGKQVPFGKLRAGSHRAYRPIRNDIDLLSAFVFLVLGFPSLDFLFRGNAAISS
jgi:hypothetical protein